MRFSETRDIMLPRVNSAQFRQQQGAALLREEIETAPAQTLWKEDPCPSIHDPAIQVSCSI